MIFIVIRFKNLDLRTLIAKYIKLVMKIIVFQWLAQERLYNIVVRFKWYNIVLFDAAMASLPRSLAVADSKYLYFMYSEMYPHKVRGYINK